MRLTVQTKLGEATIEAAGPWSEMGQILVTGPGAAAATEWLQSACGAFGNFIGTHAAPLDLHCAGVMLQAHPEPDITLVAIEGEVQEYTTGVDKGAIV